MKRLYDILVFGTVLLMTFSCTTESRYRVPRNGRVTPIRIIRYDQDFFSDGVIEDSAFWQLYTENIMQVGEADSPQTKEFMELFRNDSDMKTLYNDCQMVFASTVALEKQLEKAFYRLCYFIPDMPVPFVSMHISGFGQSIVSAPEILSASLDKFLGSDYPLYESLFYDYQRVRMCPERLAADYLNGWIRSEFTNESLMNRQCLLDYLIYEGKMLFLLQHVFPDMPIAFLTGWSEEQTVWCKANEEKMWHRIQEYDHLYSRDPLVLSKYIGDGPYTAYFTEDSPARAAIWVGFNIVEQYMQHHETVSIIELMMETDADAIFSASFYRPDPSIEK